MGNCMLKDQDEGDSVSTLNKQLFEYKYAIGRGGFGKVWRVSTNRIKGEKIQQFAMKEMLKARVMHKKSIQSVMNELKLLQLINSSFIVNAHYAFQDSDNLYLVMDLLLGGDLRYHLARQRKFSMEQTRFFCACLIHALETVHGQGIIHRDIKPENLVFDLNGYLKLTDFGIARDWQPDVDNFNETSGTPGYMAPEVMCKNNHGIAADYFAVGVIAWECMLGRRPYQGKTRREIRDAILAKQAMIKQGDVPDGWSDEAADFINKCLMRKATSRLGFNGNKEVKAHPWFDCIDWQQLQDGKLIAGYLPNPENENFDQNHVNNQEWKDAEAVKENEVHLKNPATQQHFKGYYYDKNLVISSANTKSTTAGNTGGNEIDTEGQNGPNASAGVKIAGTISKAQMDIDNVKNQQIKPISKNK